MSSKWRILQSTWSVREVGRRVDDGDPTGILETRHIAVLERGLHRQREAGVDSRERVRNDPWE